MKDIEQVDICIIGAGMVGLALAASLVDSGLRLLLVDAAPVPPSEPAPQQAGLAAFQPRVSALTQASQQLLADLGAWEAIQPWACPYLDMQVWDGAGTASIHFSAADLHQHALGHIVENARVCEALEARLADVPELVWARPDRLRCFHPLPGHQGYRVCLDSGREVETRLLVGADGGNSQVRRQAGLRVREWDYGQRAIVTTVRTGQSHDFTAWQVFWETGPLAFLPLLDRQAQSAGGGFGQAQHYCSIVWSCDTPLAEALMALDDEAFRRRLEQAFEGRLGGVEAVGRRFDFPLWQRHASDYVLEGLALVGDAAHSIHPLAGQGVNLGLLDVSSLAAVLREAQAAHRDFASLRCLSRYQRQRKADNLAMMLTMEAFKRLFGSQDLALRWLRNAGLRQVDALPWLKQRLVAQAMGL